MIHLLLYPPVAFTPKGGCPLKPADNPSRVDREYAQG